MEPIESVKTRSLKAQNINAITIGVLKFFFRVPRKIDLPSCHPKARNGNLQLLTEEEYIYTYIHTYIRQFSIQ
jgi:hypothetical protein